MRATLIVSLITAVVTLIFALSNTESMEVNLIFGVVESSKAAVLIVAFLLGIAVGILAMLPSRLRKRKTGTAPGLGTGTSTDVASSSATGKAKGDNTSTGQPASSPLRSTPPSEK